jgi:predicted dehydrogenase
VASSSAGSRERIRVAVIGAGFSGSAHVDALSRLRDVEVTGVLASSPDRAHAAAERLRVARGYASLADVLSDDDLDAVHICTPNVLHADMITAALDAGKHVLAEKPLALDAAQARTLASLAGRANVVTGVCFNYRHFPLVQQLRAEVRGGEYGRPHLIRGAYLQDWLLFPADWNWRLESARAGATRAVGDIGSHWLDLAQHVTDDRVVAVMADLGRVHEERMRPAAEVETFRQGDGLREPVGVDTEDYGSVLLRFASGSRGTLIVSQVTAGAKNRLTIGVDAATASLEWNQEHPDTLHIGRRDSASLDVPRDPAMLAHAAADLTRLPAGHAEGWADALRNQFEDFYAAVAARRKGASHSATFASFDDAYRVARLVDAIAQSDHERRWVDVPDETETTSTDRRTVAGGRGASG